MICAVCELIGVLSEVCYHGWHKDGYFGWRVLESLRKPMGGHNTDSRRRDRNIPRMYCQTHILQYTSSLGRYVGRAD